MKLFSFNVYVHTLVMFKGDFFVTYVRYVTLIVAYPQKNIWYFLTCCPNVRTYTFVG